MTYYVVIVEEYDKFNNLDRTFIPLVTSSIDRAVAVFEENVKYAESIAEEKGYDHIDQISNQYDHFFCAFNEGWYDDGRIYVYIEQTEVTD